MNKTNIKYFAQLKQGAKEPFPERHWKILKRSAYFEGWKSTLAELPCHDFEGKIGQCMVLWQPHLASPSEIMTLLYTTYAFKYDFTQVFILKIKMKNMFPRLFYDYFNFDLILKSTLTPSWTAEFLCPHWLKVSTLFQLCALLHPVVMSQSLRVHLYLSAVRCDVKPLEVTKAKMRFSGHVKSPFD